jgi:sulfatase modifying factor 1
MQWQVKSALTAGYLYLVSLALGFLQWGGPGCAFLAPLDDLVPTATPAAGSPSMPERDAGLVRPGTGARTQVDAMVVGVDSAVGAGNGPSHVSTPSSEPSRSTTIDDADAGETMTPASEDPPVPADSGMAPLGDGPVFVRIPAGTFTMGSPTDEAAHHEDEVQHQVTISRAFELTETEVTNAQYAAFLRDHPEITKPIGWTDDAPRDEPVSGVSWEDAQQFAGWLGGRLPTEAEWEYAARAGTTGSAYGDLSDVAWTGADPGLKKRPVRLKLPNAWGVYDMIGNLEEWCADWYGEYATEPVTDPTGPAEGRSRVLRGGFYGIASTARTAYRGLAYPSDREPSFGIRVAREAN